MRWLNHAIIARNLDDISEAVRTLLCRLNMACISYKRKSWSAIIINAVGPFSGYLDLAHFAPFVVLDRVLG